MQATSLRLVEQIIARSSRSRPADEVLRQTLKAEKGIRPGQAEQISRAVFSYYRWFGWRNANEPLGNQIESALDLSRRFDTDPQSFSDSELVERAVPAWVASEIPSTPAWARAIQAQPRLWLRAKPGQGGSLALVLKGSRPFGMGMLSDILEYQGQADLFQAPAFHSGQFELQDINSQAVGFVCDPKPTETWFDACAGQGGKLLHLSDLMTNKGLIWAADRASWRLQRLKRRAARAGVFNYRAALWDGGAKLPTKTKFDGVLVDAPCSGIGTWQRNPHARWTTTLQDLEELAEVQFALLKNVASPVKPGGKLVYSVCTLGPRETTAVAERFDREFPQFTRQPITNPLNASQPAQHLLLWPQDFGGNAMFIASWTRKKV
jgi:16S rRNA (cytosine967-C5)-methyltransferase